MQSLPADTLSGSVLDERNDTIDFSTGEPVHTHGGTPIDLSSGQATCPTVYKYAYLMDQASPMFGRQTTTNPFAWKIRSDVAQLDASATAYRVRDRDGAVLLDWTSSAPDGDGVYSVELHRNGNHPIPKLGTEASELHLEMRFRTTGGAESIVSTCWNNVPMAAPLVVQAAQSGALFGMSLPANSALSPLINDASLTDNVGIEVAGFAITQQTAEATPVTIALPNLSGHVTGETLSIYLQYFGGLDGAICPTATTGACANNYKDNTTRYPVSAAPLGGTWILRVVDAGGADVCHALGSAALSTGLACTIPARTNGVAPVDYRVVLSLAGESNLAPPVVFTTFGEWTLGAVSFTGSFDSSTSYGGCFKVLGTVGPFPTYKCVSDAAYYLAHVLNTARIDFDPMTFALTAGVTALKPAYLDPTTLALPAKTWDGGTEGL